MIGVVVPRALWAQHAVSRATIPSKHTGEGADVSPALRWSAAPDETRAFAVIYFWVLALSQELGLQPGLTLPQLLAQVEPHTLGMNRLVGIYSRQ